MGLVGSLIPLSIKIAKSLDDAKTKYSHASLMIASISSECSVLAVALGQIEKVVKRDNKNLSSKLDPATSDLNISLELALGGCRTILLSLDEEVKKITGAKGSHPLKWKSKVKYVWNEAGMKDLLITLRGQQAALHLLLAALQR